MAHVWRYRCLGFLKRWLGFWLRCLRFRHVWLIAFASLVELVFSDFVNQFLVYLLDIQMGTLPLMLVIGGVLAINVALTIVTMAFTLFVFRNVQRPEIYEPFICFLKSNLNHVAVEMVRVLGRAFGWTLVFIVPGIVKFIRLSFVSFIVVFNRRYLRAELDALDHSEWLSRGRWWLVFFITLLLYVLPSVLFYFWEVDPFEYASYAPQILGKALILFVSWTLYTTSLFEIFKSVAVEEDFTLAAPYVIAGSTACLSSAGSGDSIQNGGIQSQSDSGGGNIV